MNETTLQNLLHEASSCYKEGQYEACVALLNDCLLLAPHPAILANRALAHHKLQLHAQAISDLQQCLRLDHLNYLAHYNLFSLSLKADHPTAAFQHLCCAISSALTFRCKQTRDMITTERAIHYASNNKEAILLKGLLHLQKQENQLCLQMLKKALELELNPVNQAEIGAIIKRVKAKLGMKVTEENTKFVGGRHFQLHTTLSPPSIQNYSSVMKNMVSQFNILLCQLTKSAQSSKMLSMTSSGSLGSSLLQHSISSIKEDRTSNCITTHNSTLNNESECNISQQQKSLIRASYTLFMQKQSANWLVASSYNSVIPEQSSSVVDNWSSSVASSSKPQSQLEKSIYLNFTVQQVQLKQKIEGIVRQLYVVIQYNSKENALFRTSLAKSTDHVICLNDTSEEFKLSSSPSKVAVKLYRKIFTRFQDELLGQGEVVIDTLGGNSLPLFKEGRHTANVNLLTVLVQ